jgi:PAS domain-containing protein
MSHKQEPADMPPVFGTRLPISSVLALCIRHFTTLLSTLANQDRHTDLIPSLQEELGRIRVWAGNFGAQREVTDEQSLDNKLKNSPELLREVIDHFHDLDEAIQEGTFHSVNQACEQFLMLLSHHDRLRRVITV